MSIQVTTSNGVTTLEIARPEKKNALNRQMYDALTAALTAAAADRCVRAVLITGQPGFFSAGNDLQDFAHHPPSSHDSPVIRFQNALLHFDKPVVAAVTGLAVGIGTTMLFHCDLVYVSTDARLSMPFVTLGLVPEFAASVLLPHLVGHVKAAEALMLGEPISGAQAVEFGIANAALPAAEVVAHARRAAERFNALPPRAVRETKRLLRAAQRASSAPAMRDETALYIELLRGPETKEAFEAFFQKRKPDFSKLK
jgi:enoyl-CoA hydratase/carnithine racemase